MCLFKVHWVRLIVSIWPLKPSISWKNDDKFLSLSSTKHCFNTVNVYFSTIGWWPTLRISPWAVADHPDTAAMNKCNLSQAGVTRWQSDRLLPPYIWRISTMRSTGKKSSLRFPSSIFVRIPNSRFTALKTRADPWEGVKYLLQPVKTIDRSTIEQRETR